jgi:hypothetical protein
MVWYFPDDLDSFTLNIDDPDGYPIEKYLEIEKEYIKRQKEKNPYYQSRISSTQDRSYGFEDHDDRPMRYRD